MAPPSLCDDVFQAGHGTDSGPTGLNYLPFVLKMENVLGSKFSWRCFLKPEVLSFFIEKFDPFCELQEGPESMAVRVEEASKQYGAVCNF